ncbi:asparagine synthase (glutamine-hydrolyzing) [bacterium]|nr:asparagine synthase (glutamine-hydrolyzing) [bacterium]
MCGICGVAGPRGDEESAARSTRAMLATLHHRGPDDEGLEVDSGVALGARRLSVIDVQGGHQPISGEDASVTVALNGEIWNFQELREELRSKGHVFRTRSDTEVVAHLYEEHQDAAIPRLRGMFALAVHDRKRRRLLLARDRLGIKPLFWKHEGERLVFGSELATVLAGSSGERALSTEGLHHYLSLGYAPRELTLVDGISKLLPGTTLAFEQGKKPETCRYWDLPEKPDLSPDVEARSLELRELVYQAVREQLVSDVPLGVFLSGGIDSSTVLVAAKAALGRSPLAFALGFREKTHSELPFAELVARENGSELDAALLDASALDPRAFLETIVRHANDPIADTSLLPVLHLARHARKRVTVVLSGDGGDELFGGYESYLAGKLARAYRRIPRFLRAGLVRPLVSVLPLSSAKLGFEERARRFVRAAEGDFARAHFGFTGFFFEDEKRALYSETLRERTRGLDTRDAIVALAPPGQDALGKLQAIDIRSYLPDNILTKVDRMTMAASLEARPPLLDHRIVEFALRLPQELKLRGLRKKFLLKHAFAEVLPTRVLMRRKQGFSIPVHAWIRGPLREIVQEALSRERLERLGLDPAAVSAVVSSHLEERANVGFHVFALLMLSLWFDRHISHRSSRA